MYRVPGYDEYCPKKIKAELRKGTCMGYEGHTTHATAFVTSLPVPKINEDGTYFWQTHLAWLCNKCLCLVYVDEDLVRADPEE